MNDYKTKQNCTLPDTEPITALEQIALDYHYNTERFDRLFCTGKSPRGTALPANNDEYSKMAVNARQERIHALNKGKEIGFSTEEVEKAIRDFAIVFNFEKEDEYRKRCNPLPSSIRLY